MVKIQQDSAKNSAKFWQKLQKLFKNQQKFQQFLTKKLRLENGANEVLFPGFSNLDSKNGAKECNV